MSRRITLDQFYAILNEVERRIGGHRYLSNCTGKSGWPNRGLYFFFENGELRENGETPRVVRVGTHAVSRGSRATFWNRLRAHKGHADGRGNHRGSIFRKRIGECLLRVAPHPQQLHESWGLGSNASKNVRIAEQPLEIAVSNYIGQMPCLWLKINDEPSKDSHRAYLEKNAIAMLSNFGKLPIDPPSRTWLGLRSTQETIRNSGLWNTNYVDAIYDPEFLNILQKYVS